MNRRQRFCRWGAAALTCLVLGSALSVPERLPQPVQFTLHQAVDKAASFWLWVMNQPRDSVDGVSSWNQAPLQLGPPALQAPADPAEA